jgi:mRNA-degrading endonuclease RelE of RelBE toxin-antitoxin system
MPSSFRLVSTPAFERDARRRIRQSPDLIESLEAVRIIPKRDPHNRTREHNIRKLTDVKLGEGQWRIRVGVYRLRYDIIGREVILYSFRHRREVY